MRVCFAVVVLLCACSLIPNAPAFAQSTEPDLKARLMNKPLYLRGCWRDDTLHFDATGHLIGVSAPVTFTIAGFDLRKVRLRQDKLVLEGQRIGLELAGNKQKRVPIDEFIHIEIDAPTNGDYASALDAIFAENLANLVPSLPFYWKPYAQSNFLSGLPAGTPAMTPVASATSSSASQVSPPQPAKAPTPGGTISPPKILRSTETQVNIVARALGYSGKCLVNLWVEKDGSVSHLSVRQPLGLGLDENALAAVQKWVFSPAMQNGNPIRFELNVELNFQFRTN